MRGWRRNRSSSAGRSASLRSFMPTGDARSVDRTAARCDGATVGVVGASVSSLILAARGRLPANEALQEPRVSRGDLGLAGSPGPSINSSPERAVAAQ